jgi:hypothetical protein
MIRPENHAPGRNATISLRGETFYDEYAALCCALPDRPDCCIGRRVVPFTRLRGAFESDDYDPALGRVAFQRLYSAAANDIVVVERRQRFLYLLRIVLQLIGVGYRGFRDQVTRCGLDLLPSDRYSPYTADRNPNQHC